MYNASLIYLEGLVNILQEQQQTRGVFHQEKVRKCLHLIEGTAQLIPHLLNAPL